MSSAPVGFGLVGCGVIAATYAAALGDLDEARLVAAHDIDAPTGESFAAEHGIAHVGSLEGLLARNDIDVVCVCVPSGLHAEIGLAVAQAGKHVVVEKPIDISLDAARRLIDGAAAAGVSLHVISQQRYNPGTVRAKALLDEGRLGKPLLISARVPWYRSQAYYDSAAWRGTWAVDGGGAFMNQGIHYADLVCWLFGPPEVLGAHCATIGHEIEVEDVALALLGFAGGAVGVLETSTIAWPSFPTVLEVNASGGTLRLEDGALVMLDLKNDDGEASHARASPGLGSVEPGSADVGRLMMGDGHRAQLADIISAIREQRPPPVSGEDGYRALRFVLDVYQAAGLRP